jgi:hypothetical protein
VRRDVDFSGIALATSRLRIATLLGVIATNSQPSCPASFSISISLVLRSVLGVPSDGDVVQIKPFVFPLRHHYTPEYSANAIPFALSVSRACPEVEVGEVSEMHGWYPGFCKDSARILKRLAHALWKGSARKLETRRLLRRGFGRRVNCWFLVSTHLLFVQAAGSEEAGKVRCGTA